MLFSVVISFEEMPDYAAYTGAKQEADWWLHQKITEKGKASETRYTSYVLHH